MAAVITDIIEGNNAVLTKTGWELHRIFTVSGLAGNGYAMMKEALDVAGIPDYGDAHPDTGITYCYAINITPRSIPSSGNAVKVDVHYKSWDTAKRVRNIIGSPKEVTTAFHYPDPDISTSEEMYLGYTYPSGYWNPDYASVGLVEMNPIADVIQPLPIIMISRYEVGTTYTVAFQTARSYETIGHTNKYIWEGGAAGKWLCNDIRYRQLHNFPSGIFVWEATYSFQYSGSGWTFEGFFVDPNTGFPPKDIVSGTGYKEFNVYLRENFNNLGL